MAASFEVNPFPGSCFRGIMQFSREPSNLDSMGVSDTQRSNRADLEVQQVEEPIRATKACLVTRAVNPCSMAVGFYGRICLVTSSQAMAHLTSSNSSREPQQNVAGMERCSAVSF